MKPMRRGFMGGAYGTGGPGVLPPTPFAHAPRHAPPPPQPAALSHPPMPKPQPPPLAANGDTNTALKIVKLHSTAGLCRPPSPITGPPKVPGPDFTGTSSSNIPTSSAPNAPEPTAPASENVSGGVLSAAADTTAEDSRGVVGGAGGAATSGGSAASGPGDAEAARPAPSALANSKEKTPMCLVNELARYNKIKHQYRLTSETGPAHKKVFTVTLRLGETEEYTAEGSSIKRAQHAAASAALSQTRYSAPPPRSHPPHMHANAHHRHAGAVMPTVELNALAMKLCQPAVYTAMPPVPAPARFPRARPPPPHPHAPYRPHAPFIPHLHPQRMLGPGLVYRVRVAVGGRAWLGEGPTPQAARHDAAARALHDLRTSTTTDRPSTVATSATAVDDDNADSSTDALNSDVKSPVSLVHELALKQALSVTFTVKSERGPPHMRVFVTTCCVGDMETDGEGNGKKHLVTSAREYSQPSKESLGRSSGLRKEEEGDVRRSGPLDLSFTGRNAKPEAVTSHLYFVSKRRAAERMLEEMRRRWPAALLRARPPPAVKRKPQPPKKKTRNLIKESVEGGGGGEGSGGAEASDNPISRLAMARHAARARSPQYRVVEERGAARRREFVVQCDAPPHCATGLGPNKKTAKRRAAHNVLLAMEMAGQSTDSNATNTKPADSSNDAVNTDKRKESESSATNSGMGGGEGRQPVPGVLLMDYHQRAHTASTHNGVTENTPNNAGTNGTGGANGTANGGNTPGAKDQLMYLSHLLGFTVQFSDFPKRNHGEYLSLVSLSTEPPVMCHGGGASTAQSHEQCSRAALRALALMGLDAPTDR
ncbi:Double-stranded RNA-binding protein Staufen homolog 2 [Eumeta japonica]|uniref:Double-stranded RNA-binding protein Staufen homolog 2 n=1 Tax=Eumeta variegata TaxID=151549 RepID=A0A4C1Y4S1_EUMVA|nr:Double-stranded RNA-binding protein Staufen homolog 2 [Eumeta japonica]